MISPLHSSVCSPLLNAENVLYLFLEASKKTFSPLISKRESQLTFAERRKKILFTF